MEQWIDVTSIKDYILLMLGAPVIRVELDDKQIEFSIKQSEENIDEYIKSSNLNDRGKIKYQRLLKEGALIFGKRILGRIRSKYKTMPGTCEIKLDGDTLLKESKLELAYWKEDIKSSNKENIYVKDSI